MGKTVIESNYRRFKPVRQAEKCAVCPSGCKTSCARRDVVAANIKRSEAIEDQGDYLQPDRKKFLL